MRLVAGHDYHIPRGKTIRFSRDFNINLSLDVVYQSVEGSSMLTQPLTLIEGKQRDYSNVFINDGSTDN
jgi:hypothetical protein